MRAAFFAAKRPGPRWGPRFRAGPPSAGVASGAASVLASPVGGRQRTGSSSTDSSGTTVAVAAMSSSVSTSLARRMEERGIVTVSPPSSGFSATLSSSAERMRPRQRRRPSCGTWSSAIARWPRKRVQSFVRISGRSMPADETSRLQSPGNGSSTSITAPTAWEIASQSETPMSEPSARSAITCTVGRSLPCTCTCTRTSS